MPLCIHVYYIYKNFLDECLIPHFQYRHAVCWSPLEIPLEYNRKITLQCSSPDMFIASQASVHEKYMFIKRQLVTNNNCNLFSKNFWRGHNSPPVMFRIDWGYKCNCIQHWHLEDKTTIMAL